jgi:competence protein ComFC
MEIHFLTQLIQKIFRTLHGAIFPNPPQLTFLLNRLQTDGPGFLAKNRDAKADIQTVYSYTSSDVRMLIHEMKYRRNKFVAQSLTQNLYEEMTSEIAEQFMDIHEKPILTYIPSTKSTRLNRGFQHIDTLRDAFKEIDQNLFFHHHFPLLQYKTKKKRQTQMKTRNERLENMRNVFIANESVRDKIVFLVDDVTTTGATLRDAKRALEESGARKVYLFALAH